MKCPEGYEATKVQGDVPGPGLISLGTGKNIPAKTITKCAEICSHNGMCKAFLHSKKQGQCKLSGTKNPSAKQFMDFVFCKKSGVYYKIY